MSKEGELDDDWCTSCNVAGGVVDISVLPVVGEAL